MAELVTGDKNKNIRGVGELVLRISRFDSYRLFTLYENANDRKVMNVSGNHKYYLVFRSPKKEIRIPEYDPKGNFEVDKVNGCVLFKITKKNADDILSMKTGGERIFYIVRVFEEKDAFGKVLSVTDEVEVYNGKWGDDESFSAFYTDNTVESLLTQLALMKDDYANLLTQYSTLENMYINETVKAINLEKELEAMRVERDSLQALLDEYTNNTHDGTLLSTDTKYIAFTEAMDSVTLTDEELQKVTDQLLEKGEVDMSEFDLDSPRIELDVEKILDTNLKDLKITAYLNNVSIGSSTCENRMAMKTIEIGNGDKLKFECTGMTSASSKYLQLTYIPGQADFETCKKAIKFEGVSGSSTEKFENIYYEGKQLFGQVLVEANNTSSITVTFDFMENVYDAEGNQIFDKNENGEDVPRLKEVNLVGFLGRLSCNVSK